MISCCAISTSVNNAISYLLTRDDLHDLETCCLRLKSSFRGSVKEYYCAKFVSYFDHMFLFLPADFGFRGSGFKVNRDMK